MAFSWLSSRNSNASSLKEEATTLSAPGGTDADSDTVSELPARDGKAQEAARSLLGRDPTSVRLHAHSLLRSPKALGTSASTPRLPFLSMSPAGGDANSLMSILRRELDLLEERLNQRIMRAERSADQFRALAITQLDERLGDIGAWRSAQEREVSQLSGTLTGVREELQNLFQRTNQNAAVPFTQHQVPQMRGDELASTLKVRLGVFECELQAARATLEEQVRRIDMTESKVDVLLENCSSLTAEAKGTLGSKVDATARIMEKLAALDQKLDSHESKLQSMGVDAERLARAVQLQDSRTDPRNRKFSAPASAVATFGSGPSTEPNSSTTPCAFSSFSVEKIRGKFENNDARALSSPMRDWGLAERVAQQN